MLYGRFLRRILAAASRPSALLHLSSILKNSFSTSVSVSRPSTLLHLFPDYKTDMLPF
jgi:hypothetical protein